MNNIILMHIYTKIKEPIFIGYVFAGIIIPEGVCSMFLILLVSMDMYLHKFYPVFFDVE
jgi:hypothetical protein